MCTIPPRRWYPGVSTQVSKQAAESYAPPRLSELNDMNEIPHELGRRKMATVAQEIHTEALRRIT